MSGPHDEINLKILGKDDEPRVCSPEEYEADFDSSRHGAGDVAIQPFTLPKDGGEELIGAGRLELVGPFDWNVGRTMEPPRNRDIAASGPGLSICPAGRRWWLMWWRSCLLRPKTIEASHEAREYAGRGAF